MRANAADCLDKIEEMSWTDIGARLRIRIPGGRDRGCGTSRVSSSGLAARRRLSWQDHRFRRRAGTPVLKAPRFPARGEDLPPKSSEEEALLDGVAAERKPNSRLSCQLTVVANMEG
jgi:hypothetical protein